MIRLLHVWYYKRKAKKAYLKWLDANSDLNCGAHMAEMLRPGSLERPAMAFDHAMDKLRKLGEPVPSHRLSNNLEPGKQSCP